MAYFILCICLIPITFKTELLKNVQNQISIKEILKVKL